MNSSNHSTNSDLELQLFLHKNEFLAYINVNEKNLKPSNKSNFISNQTVIIIDQSTSMRDHFYLIRSQIMPIFFTKLQYDKETEIHLITFHTDTKYEKVKVEDFQNIQPSFGLSAKMAPAVAALAKIFTEFPKKTSFVRILTISDGKIDDQLETKLKGNELAKIVKSSNITVNSQAVRFTSENQLDTTALCSLLQLNNITASNLIDLSPPHVTNYSINAEAMAKLFKYDGYREFNFIKTKNKIFARFLCDEQLTNEMKVFAGENVFWLKKNSISDKNIFKLKLNSKIELELPNLTLKINDQRLKVTIRLNITVETIEKFFEVKVPYSFDRIKVRNVIGTTKSYMTIKEMLEYLKKIESAALNEQINNFDTKTLKNRVNFMKLQICSRNKTSTMLANLTTDDKVSQLNSMQKAAYLRHVTLNTIASRGLVKRAAKKTDEDFDQIARYQVRVMVENIAELEEIDDNNHKKSFYSHATTIEGIRTLVEFSKDLLFDSMTALDILQFLTVVGIACDAKIGEFPDASAWHVKEMFYGCYVSIADIMTVKKISSQYELKVPGINKKITNAIPIFDDPKIEIFLKKYAPLLIEYSSSIGMRRNIADVSMTLGYTIIAGIRKMMHDLINNRSTIHLETFQNLVQSAALFVRKYFNHIEEQIKTQEISTMRFYIGNNGISNLIVPLIRIHMKNDKEMKKKIPIIMKAVANYEIWKTITKKHKKSKRFLEICKENLDKLLGIVYEDDSSKFDKNLTNEAMDNQFEDSINYISSKLSKKPKIQATKSNEKLVTTNYLTPNHLSAENTSNGFKNYTINEKLMKEFSNSLYYIRFLPLYSKFLCAAINNNMDVIKNYQKSFKNAEAHQEFLFLNIYQALRYPRFCDRVDEQKKVMKITDVRNKNEITKEIQNYVKLQHQTHYKLKLRQKLIDEELKIAKVIVESITNTTDIQGAIQIWRKGMKRDEKVYKINNCSHVGFKVLRKQLVDMQTKSIPLRSELIRILLLCVDSEGYPVYNNGEVCNFMKIKKFKAAFLSKSSNDEWKEIEEKFNSRKVHQYRGDKKNRHGHDNSMPSYWAMGFDKIDDFYEKNSVEEIKEYLRTHLKCCHKVVTYR